MMFENCQIEKANLTRANFHKSTFRNCNFLNMNLIASDFSDFEFIESYITHNKAYWKLITNCFFCSGTHYSRPKFTGEKNEFW